MERKMVRVATAIVFSCCLIGAPASTILAQEGARTESTADDDDDNDTDFGWIGLIGLAGLLGLRRKDHVDHRTDTSRPGTTR